MKHSSRLIAKVLYSNFDAITLSFRMIIQVEYANFYRFRKYTSLFDKVDIGRKKLQD